MLHLVYGALLGVIRQNSAWLPWRGLAEDCAAEKPNAGEVAEDWGGAKCSSDAANDFQPPTWKSDTPIGHPDLHALLSTSADEDAPLPAVNANSGLKSWRVERWDRMREFPSGGFICWSAFHRMTTVLETPGSDFLQGKYNKLTKLKNLDSIWNSQKIKYVQFVAKNTMS